MNRTRWAALACMLAVTLAVIGWTASAEPDRKAPSEDGPRVRILSLADLEPWDTDPMAENNWGPVWGADSPADAADMDTVLAETTTGDGTIVRLYATADGLIDGAFSRSGGERWTCFVHLFRGGDVGPNFAAGATLTPYEDVMGRDGFLLRTDGYYLGTYNYWYYWFDPEGTLRVLHAYMDPASMDLDGCGEKELVFNFDQFRSSFAFYYSAGGRIFRVIPGELLGGTFLGLEGGESVRLLFEDGDGGVQAVTFTGDALRAEQDAAFAPPAGEAALAPLPQPAYEGRLDVTISAPDGWVMDGAGGEVYDQLWYWLSDGGPVLTRTEAPLDAQSAYTVTLADPETGEAALVWTLDAGGLCRFSRLEGTYRLERTKYGTPPAAVRDLLEIYCAASRTSRDYDETGRHLGESLALNAAAGR